MSDWLPRRKTLWLLFDLSNGHKGSHRYVWWFDTKREALAHKAWQEGLSYAAKLSEPIKGRIE